MFGAALLHLTISLEDTARDVSWEESDWTVDGRQRWEHSFPAQGQQPGFHVTILFDPVSRRSRVLYTSRMPGGGHVPRIPTEVRRQAETFARRLETTISSPEPAAPRRSTLQELSTG